jgi:hypothetical protein
MSMVRDISLALNGHLVLDERVADKAVYQIHAWHLCLRGAMTIPFGTFHPNTPRESLALRQGVRRTVFSPIYPRGCFGTPLRNDFSLAPRSRLTQRRQWSPHLKALGVNGRSLGPVVKSTAQGDDTAHSRGHLPNLLNPGESCTTNNNRSTMTILPTGRASSRPPENTLVFAGTRAC